MKKTPSKNASDNRSRSSKSKANTKSAKNGSTHFASSRGEGRFETAGDYGRNYEGHYGNNYGARNSENGRREYGMETYGHGQQRNRNREESRYGNQGRDMNYGSGRGEYGQGRDEYYGSPRHNSDEQSWSRTHSGRYGEERYTGRDDYYSRGRDDRFNEGRYNDTWRGMEDYPQGNYNAARGYGPEQESRNDADMRNSRSGRNIGGNRGNIDRYADEEFENENAYGRPGRNTDVDFADEDVRYGRDSQETDDLDREDRSSYGRSRGNWMTDNRHRQSPRSRNNQGY